MPGSCEPRSLLSRRSYLIALLTVGVLVVVSTCVPMIIRDWNVVPPQCTMAEYHWPAKPTAPPRYHGPPAEFPDRYTLILNSYKRPQLLQRAVAHYAQCRAIDAIRVSPRAAQLSTEPTHPRSSPHPVLPPTPCLGPLPALAACVCVTMCVWCEDGLPPNRAEASGYYSDIKEVRYDIVSNSSLNNRFWPLEGLRTEAVLSLDDDIVAPCEVLEELFALLLYPFAIGLSKRLCDCCCCCDCCPGRCCVVDPHTALGVRVCYLVVLIEHVSFQVWRRDPYNMAGFYPRLHVLDQRCNYRYLQGFGTLYWHRKYSLVLTKAAMLHRDYLEYYTNHMDYEIRRHVDEAHNCEDLAMALLVGSSIGRPPAYVLPYHVKDLGKGLFKVKGISSGTKHGEIRSHCLNVFSQYYGAALPLAIRGVHDALPGELGVGGVKGGSERLE
ncbi:acetylglucosaminyltransferase [Volvox carteri f. nagariensis]|uniref:Acetylglucosaminyltransferase n=1 Tax=Volvox carteri f. nagariensis TaxID=3068 RepID=D8TP47_VOLCA|nr:acetylglucosaminyltransferase [Volvox carteri f. nagariensis]EFJ50698.1 acetylglucosaminyltransferase [Volvox carteri f. nagariensis]|eukprot:XP_002948291.1 acetylglucosaminyltransferase [Volvox carteri f. nagariensis]